MATGLSKVAQEQPVQDAGQKPGLPRKGTQLRKAVDQAAKTQEAVQKLLRDTCAAPPAQHPDSVGGPM